MDEKERLLALQNVTGETVSVTLPVEGQWHDLVAGTTIDVPTIELQAYQVIWLKQIE